MKYLYSIFVLSVLLSGCISTPGEPGKGKVLYELEKKLTSPVVTIPTLQKEVLNNGLTLILMQRKGLPVLHTSVNFIHGGSVFDPEKFAGLANLTSSLLEKGTENRTALEIAEALDFVGAGISASCSKDTASVSLDILSEYTDFGLELLADIIINPAFADPEIERVKQQVLSSILGERDQYDEFASKMFSEYVYKNHPYHRPVNGYEETISNISVKDIREFHKKHYIPNDAIMVVVGDFDGAEIINKIRAMFDNWEKGNADFDEPGEVENLSNKKVFLFNRDVTQTTICIGHPGFKRINPDFYPVLLLNQILGGGGLTSRVGRKIRTEMGLAYSVSTYFVVRKYGGSFLAFTQTRNENAHLSVQALLDEMDRIRDEPVTAEELHAAKSYYNGSFPLRFETNEDFANTLFFIEMYDMGLSYFRDYLDRVNSTTIVDIQRIANKYISTDDFIIIAVTKAEEVLENFKKFGEVEVID